MTTDHHLHPLFLHRLSETYLFVLTPPTLEDVQKAIRVMKNDKDPGMDSAVTAEALQGGGDVMANTIHAFCVAVFNKHTAPDQWSTTCNRAPAEERGPQPHDTLQRDYTDVNYTAKLYNKVLPLLMRIRAHVDPILWRNQIWLPPK